MHAFDPQHSWRDIGTITPYPFNSKEHTEEQIAKLAGVISTLGFDQAIVVDGDGVIIKGHGRRLAALRLGLTQVPVIVRTDLSKSQVKALRLSDNLLADTKHDAAMLRLDLETGPIEGFALPDLCLGNFLSGVILPDSEPAPPPPIKDGAKELGEDEFQDFDQRCPKCGFEFDNA